MSIADKGSILYTVVARGDAVLADYAYVFVLVIDLHLLTLQWHEHR